MYCGVYAPWDHAPKFLRFSEVMDPMNPVRYFFDAHDVEGHQQALKNWRHYVVNDEYYNNERFGPSVLYHDYELNVRLIESLYLLFLEDQEHSYHRKKVSHEQLNTEKQEWDWYPVELTEEELRNPFTILKAAFEEVKLQEFRDHLSEWLAAVLSTHAIDETMSPGEIITVYEHLKKMYSAAWLIFQRSIEKSQTQETSETSIKKTYLTKDVKEEKPLNEIEQAAVPVMVTEPTVAEEMTLKQVVDFIIKSTPAVQLINHLGTHREPFIFFLFIVVDHTDMDDKEEITRDIEEKCRTLVSIVAIVKKLRGVRKKLDRGSRFITNSIWNKTLYISESLKIPGKEKTTAIRMTRGELNDAWEKYGSIGCSLSIAAREYQLKNSYQEAVFTADQAIEYLLRTAIIMETGHDPQTIDIRRLLKITLLFTDRYWNLFHKNSESSVKAFALLTAGFDGIRVERTEPIEEAAINTLILSTEILAIRVENLYHHLMSETTEE
ncbi:HEPN domain-containing protein [Mucilaginibacter oryzae]|uniref:HEPN domain-containing protein n=1 Tax=Mucilaginibacter oryzae TaxID=468058 RepID=A0A316HXH1_9SPHI|nr:HEPN domain-containing protein [Mucilaginibacter oryzae]PWK79712.1 HEPN domain-containing protein [Mucilaginibacter oryzae]